MRKIFYFIIVLLFNKVTVAQINIATGGGGTVTGVAQSYNENRGAEVVVLSPVNIPVQSITLNGFYCGSNGGTDSAYLGARIYNSSTAAQLAWANDSVYYIHGTSVTIPISYTLVSGKTYRISVYAWGPHAPTGNSGLMYHPANLPYTEPSGMLQIMHGYDGYNDTMPTQNNIYVPLITLNLAITGVGEVNLTNTFSLYPNPFSTQAILKFNNPAKEKFTLSIYNLQGQLVQAEENIFSDYVAIDRKNLNSGLYFFQLMTERKGIVAGKFMVD